MKQTKCHECWGLNGRHWPTCLTRGYGAVGPHPDAPARDDAPPTERAEPEMCCGGTCVRALCFIHSTEPKAKSDEPAAFDEGHPLDANNPRAHFYVWQISPCGLYKQMWRDGKLVDEVPL